MTQIQFANRVKKQKKNRTYVKKQILHNLDRTSEKTLKVRLQKFLGRRGYLPKAKSL